MILKIFFWKKKPREYQTKKSGDLKITALFFLFIISNHLVQILVQIKKHLSFLQCKCLIFRLPKLDSNQRPSD